MKENQANHQQILNHKEIHNHFTLFVSKCFIRKYRNKCVQLQTLNMKISQKLSFRKILNNEEIQNYVYISIKTFYLFVSSVIYQKIYK